MRSLSKAGLFLGGVTESSEIKIVEVVDRGASPELASVPTISKDGAELGDLYLE
jgi:hypothetical protein